MQHAAPGRSGRAGSSHGYSFKRPPYLQSVTQPSIIRPGVGGATTHYPLKKARLVTTDFHPLCKAFAWVVYTPPSINPVSDSFILILVVHLDPNWNQFRCHHPPLTLCLGRLRIIRTCTTHPLIHSSSSSSSTWIRPADRLLVRCLELCRSGTTRPSKQSIHGM
jgi:hypothetical protein